MSKIFEALKKTEGEVADLALPLLTEDAVASGGAEMVEDIVRQTAEAFPLEAVAEHAMASPASAVEAPRISPPVAAHGQANGAGIRTVAIRLAVDTPILPF